MSIPTKKIPTTAITPLMTPLSILKRSSNMLNITVFKSLSFLIASVRAFRSENSMATFFSSMFVLGVAYTAFKIFQTSLLLLEKSVSKHKSVDWNSRTANFIAGAFALYYKKCHGLDKLLTLPVGGKVVVLNHPCGPFEGIAVAVASPERLTIVCTNQYNHIPFVKKFLDLWGVIYVDFSSKAKSIDKESKTSQVVDACARVISEGKTVLIFPFGARQKIGPTDEPVIREGFAKMAFRAFDFNPKADIKICPFFIYGLDPNAYGQFFWSMLPWPFNKNRIKIEPYPVIDTPMLKSLAAEERPLARVTSMIYPILSMKINSDKYLQMRDEAHDSVARDYALTKKSLPRRVTFALS